MLAKRLRISGALGLALGIALAPVPGTAGNETSSPKSGFEKLVEAKFGGKVKVNDYSDLGAEYGGVSATQDANETSSSAGGPKVNDYSAMGADYGEPAGKGGAENPPAKDGEKSATETANVTTEALITGYQKFNGTCAQCHGEDGVGSTFAPSLVNRLKTMERAEFIEVVTNGKTVFNSSTGSYSVMPPWAGNKDVMAHLNELWAYLKARSDGELGQGRPE